MYREDGMNDGTQDLIDNGTGATKMTRKEHERELALLQAELVRVQEWVVREGIKVAIVFEGRDGAGKGGVIKRITERVSPRVFRVVALPAPSDRERGQMMRARPSKRSEARIGDQGDHTNTP
jgi:polyphosphate kinase